MKHLLIDIDSTIPNFALMKISAWAKQKGDTVYLNKIDDNPDFIWISCIFTWHKQIAENHITMFSVEYPNAEIHYGGTGFDAGKPFGDPTRKYLPKEIDNTLPDYDLYGDDRAIGFCQRGCDRKCEFCLPPETSILTGDGLKSIVDVSVGDMVLTHKGRYRKVTKVMKREFDGNLYNIQTSAGSNYYKFQTWTTPEHPIFVRHRSYTTGGAKLTSFKWVPAEEIKPYHRNHSTDFVAFPVLKEVRDVGSIDDIQITTEFMHFLGYYVAEGHLVYTEKRNRKWYRTVLSFGKNDIEREYADRSVRDLASIGIKARCWHLEGGYRVIVDNVKLTRWIKKHIGTGSQQKRLPLWIKLLPLDKLNSFFSAYIEGDGSVGIQDSGNKYMRSITISPNLAIDFYIIGMKLGYYASINGRDGGFHNTIQGRSVDAKDIFTNIYSIPLVRKHSVKSDDNYQYHRVSKQTKYYQGIVYNLEVEEDNSFCTPFVCVHNCDVWQKEGRIENNEYHRLRGWVPDDKKKVLLLDNDVALVERWKHDEILKDARDLGVKLSITQGYDIREIAKDHSRAYDLAEQKPYDTGFKRHTLYIAWDMMGIEKYVRNGIETLLDAGFKGSEIKCYIIVGFPDRTLKKQQEPYMYYEERDLYRANVLWKEYGVYPWVMPYNNVKMDRKIVDFERWINRYLFKKMDFQDYKRGFKYSNAHMDRWTKENVVYPNLEVDE